VVWEAMYRLMPWGDDWEQSARIEAAIRNTMGGQEVTPAELIPTEDNRQPDEEPDAATLNANVRAWLNL
jgi:hypothetical protein